MISSVQIWELITVLTSISYVYLAGKGKIIGWVFAIISSAIYVFLNFDKQLYFFAALQFFYVIVAVYGWIAWKRESTTLHYRFFGWKNVWILGVGAGVAIAIAIVASRYTDQEMPYLDAFNFVFCLFASWMISRKIMESWLYLIIFDLLAIYINFKVELYQTAILYLILAILGANAYREWMKEYQRNQSDR